MKSNNNKKNRQINTMFQRKQGGDREYLETLLHIRGDLSEKLTCEIRITHTHTHTHTPQSLEEKMENKGRASLMDLWLEHHERELAVDKGRTLVSSICNNRYKGLGGLNNSLFLSVLDAWKSKTKVPTYSVPGEGPLLSLQTSLYVLTWWKRASSSLFLFI